MATAPDTVGLRIGSVEWRAWSEVSIARSIEQVCSTAALSLVNVDWSAGMTDRTGALLEIVPSSYCEVWIGQGRSGECVIRGHVDADETTTSEGCAYKVEVRSMVADLVDCTHRHKTGVFRGQTVESIASALADPYGINVLCETDTGPAVEMFRVEKTETVIRAIERLARERGLLVTDDTLGNLVITTVAVPGKVAAILERGRNVKSLTRRRDVSQRFAHYLVRGQATDDFGAEGAVDDLWVRRNRTLCIDHERAGDKAACLRRAKWEATTRAGRSVRYEVEVAGWRIDPSDPSSDLWWPNTLVRLVDPVLQIDDDLLVVRVNFQRSVRSGTTTRITLGYPDGYAPEPPRYRRGRGGHAVTGWADLQGGI